MKYKKWIWAMIFLMAASSLECALAQEKSAQLDKEALFQLLDRNRDDRISPKEFGVIWKDKEAAREAFKRMDLNNDGFLSKEEFGRPGTVLFTW
jgi:Ca2+-binding EF-hand superfamily protein